MRKRLRNEKVMVERTDNIFGIIGMGHMEIKHSNFLAWMLDPHNPHGCGSKFLYLLMSKRGIEVHVMNGNNPKQIYDIFEGKTPGTKFLKQA